jgi:hypothetical protein
MKAIFVFTSRIFFYFFQAFLSGFPANLGIGSSSKALGQMWAQLYFIGHFTGSDGLGIRIADNKIHTIYILAEHVINSVAASTTYPNHFENR